MVRGLLQRKIFSIRILLWCGVAVLILYSLGDIFPGIRDVTGKVPYFLLFLAPFLLFIDMVYPEKNIYILDKSFKLPPSYSEKNYIKFFAETVLRLFSFPVAIGLYRLNGAGTDSPLLVTGNFSLSVRRVVQGVGREPVWLLVADSRGVNVWCSTLAGHFSTDNIIEAVRLFEPGKKMTCRRLILPQLAAAGVSPRRLKQETGFDGEFGPHSADDLKEYLLGHRSEKFALASFPLKRRLEMALGAPVILMLLYALIFNFISPVLFLLQVPFFYLFSLVHGALFPWRPVKNIPIWSLFAGLMSGFLFYLALQFSAFDSRSLLVASAFGFGCFYLVNEFTGWSPLVKYNLIPFKKPDISIDASCINCRQCIVVCPRGVFVSGDTRTEAAWREKCILCHSCYRQCPAGAIHHSAERKKEST